MAFAPFVQLDSSDPTSPWRFEASPARAVLRSDALGNVTRLTGQFGTRTWTDPLEALAWMSETPIEPRARWIGYLSYDLGRLFERLPERAGDELALPLFVFSYHAEMVGGGEIHGRGACAIGDAPLKSNFSRGAYEAAVARAVEYVGAGDVFQVNLSQRFSAGLREQPEVIYSRLRERFPAKYGAYLDYGDHALLCNSPELFLSVNNRDGKRRVMTRPIKGTRPRRPGMEQALRDSKKDEAELNMIVDLERNDLGRVCEIGSVRVTGPRAIEAHPTVYHGVATVEGTLRDDVSFVDLLRATFPGGSVTGAPKIRAMEIIEELEPTRRGPYCGAIGYLAANGEMQLNVAIRTMIVKDGLAHIPVGGGVVADSTPHGEYEETLVKARAMFGALGIGEIAL